MTVFLLGLRHLVGVGSNPGFIGGRVTTAGIKCKSF